MSISATLLSKAVPISSVIEGAQTGFASGEDVEDGILQVRMNNIATDGSLDWSKRRRVPIPSKGVDKVLAKSGDVLFNHTNSPELVGKSAFFSGFDEPVTFSNHFISLRPKASILDGRYLARWLQKHWSEGRFQALCKQWVNQATVSKDTLLGLEIPLPPLEEQKRIAAILDQADDLRRKRQHALTRLKQIGQAIFYEMFVEGDCAEWPISLVDTLVDENVGGIRTGPFGSQLLHSEFVDDGIAVLGIDNAVSNQFQWGQRRYITPEKYNTLRRYRVYPGDVIITIMGTCGRCAIVPSEIPLAINTKHLCCISLQREICAPEYLHAYFLNHPMALKYLQSKSKGAIMDGLNMGIIKAIPIRLPPLRLQQQFIEKLSLIEDQRKAVFEAAEIAHRLFTSLQHRAFRSELTASSLNEAAA